MVIEIGVEPLFFCKGKGKVIALKLSYCWALHKLFCGAYTPLSLYLLLRALRWAFSYFSMW